MWRLLPLRVWRHLVPSSGTNSTANPGCSWRVGVGVKGQRLCATAALAAGSGLCRGCQHRADVLIPVCPCRIWTTVSFPNGMRSWSWMRNEGKGGSKEGDGGLGAPGRAGGLHLLLQGRVLGCHQERGDTGPGRPQRSWNGNQKHCRRGDAPALLPVRRPRHSPLSSPGGSSRLPARCLQFLTAPPARGCHVFQVGYSADQGTENSTAAAAPNVQKERNSGVRA